jgi:hypothetical protein
MPTTIRGDQWIKGKTTGRTEKRMVSKKAVSFAGFLKCVHSICVSESLLLLNRSTVSIIGHCNQWGLRALPFCSSDEGAYGSDPNFEDRDQVVEGRPAEKETLSEGRDTGDS